MTSLQPFLRVSDLSDLGRQAGLQPAENRTAASAAGDDPASKFAKVGKEFEAVFLNEAIESIFPKVEGGSFGSGTAGNIFRSMLAENIANTITKHGGLGIANYLTAVQKNETITSAT